MWTLSRFVARSAFAAGLGGRALSTSSTSLAPVSVALVGAGRIGNVHGAALASNPGAKIAIVADADADAAAALAQRLGVARHTTDAEAAIKDGSVDAVFVCSPTDKHAEHSVMAANHGKHVFCEKPISLNLETIDATLETMNSSGVKFMVGFNRRFDANFERVREAIAAGEIGALHQLRITSRDPSPPPISYIKVSGGILCDMTVHDFDMARFLVGDEVEEVFCYGGCMVDPSIGEAGDMDTVTVLLKFKNGVQCAIDNSRQAVYGYDQRVEAFGSKGAAQAENEYPNQCIISSSESVRRANLPHHFFLERYMAAYKAIGGAFIDAVAQDTPVPVGGSDGRAAVALGMAAKRSVDEGRPVKLSEFS